MSEVKMAFAKAIVIRGGSRYAIAAIPTYDRESGLDFPLTGDEFEVAIAAPTQWLAPRLKIGERGTPTMAAEFTSDAIDRTIPTEGDILFVQFDRTTEEKREGRFVCEACCEHVLVDKLRQDERARRREETVARQVAFNKAQAERNGDRFGRKYGNFLIGGPIKIGALGGTVLVGHKTPHGHRIRSARITPEQRAARADAKAAAAKKAVAKAAKKRGK